MVGRIFCILQLLVTLRLSVCSVEPVQNDIQHNGTLHIVKRHLRWEKNNGFYIKSDNLNFPNLMITNYQPHPKNVEVLDNMNYLAFTLYKVQGQSIPPDTGIFHFINDNEAANNRFQCSPNTMHSGAYYYFYDKCPQVEKNMVASGYCSQSSTLKFNSFTFNSKGTSYMDNHYYLNDDRVTASTEKTLLTDCYNAWKSAGFPVNGWTYKVSASSIKRRSTVESNSKSEISGCECDDPCMFSSAFTISWTPYMLVTSYLINKTLFLVF